VNVLVKVVSIFSFCAVLALAQATHENSYYSMKKEAYRLHEHHQSDKAIAYVEDFIRTHPKNYRAKNLLAHFYYWNGNKQKARAILEEVVSHSDLQEAKRLLQKLRRTSLGEKEEIHDDLAFLKAYIKNHPVDIKARKYLLNYYISLNNKKEASRLAKEILRIDPDEIETLALIRDEGLDLSLFEPSRQCLYPEEKMDKVVELLQLYYAQKAYTRYVNFYKSLEHLGFYLPAYIHTQALEVALMLGEYKMAKKIILLYEKKSKEVQKLDALIEQKLHTTTS